MLTGIYLVATVPCTDPRRSNDALICSHTTTRALKLILMICVSTEAVYFHLCSQSVEGGGHRVLTELYNSLTEDDAGADQHHATCDGGDNNGQDQRCRYLVLWRWPLRSYRESHLLDALIYVKI